MEIRENNFENYGEVDCKARNKVVNIKPTGALPFFGLSIRRIGRDEYQAYAKFTQDMMHIQTENGQTVGISEIVLKEGTLVEVVSFTNEITSGKDTVSKAVDPRPTETAKKSEDKK